MSYKLFDEEELSRPLVSTISSLNIDYSRAMGIIPCKKVTAKVIAIQQVLKSEKVAELRANMDVQLRIYREVC